MNTKRICLFFLLIFGLFSELHAQDVVYSQFYANPLYLNPALAGSKYEHRLTVNYRNQWPGIRKGYVSYHASWDQYYKAISGAVGVIVNSEIEGGGVYKRYSASGIYSFHFNITDNIEVKSALQAGYLNYSLNWDGLVLGDQMIDVNTGTIGTTVESLPEKQNVGKADFSAGLVTGFKRSMFLGIAANHISRPDFSFYNGITNRLNMKWTVHLGMLFNPKDKLEVDNIRDFSVSPNLVYVQQGEFHQLNAGMYVNKYPFVFGFWMRHNFENPDAFIVLLGFQQKDYKIGYSFDYTLSSVSVYSGGAHEISVSYLFNNTATVRKHKQIRSPDF